MIRPTTHPRAFTLIEILVVIGIVVILLGLLIPAIGMITASARATRSMSNLRSFATAFGTFAAQRKDRIPWEGEKNIAGIANNLAEPNFWANALGPLMDSDRYAALVEDAFREQRDVASWSEPNTVWADPSATSESGTPWEFGEAGPEGVKRQFWFGYVMNIRLNNVFLQQLGLPDTHRTLMSHAHIDKADRTVLMLELRGRPQELPPNDPHFTRNLDRSQSSWKRFAARHFEGGHLLFSDGHAEWALNRDVTTNAQGSRDPLTPDGDWNTERFIFEPQGPARN
jgi:prepilin-type N-terminal cleavage/methylation domain-containing protein